VIDPLSLGVIGRRRVYATWGGRIRQPIFRRRLAPAAEGIVVLAGATLGYWPKEATQDL
jgi:hypothetical protein